MGGIISGTSYSINASPFFTAGLSACTNKNSFPQSKKQTSLSENFDLTFSCTGDFTDASTNSAMGSPSRRASLFLIVKNMHQEMNLCFTWSKGTLCGASMHASAQNHHPDRAAEQQHAGVRYTILWSCSCQASHAAIKIISVEHSFVKAMLPACGLWLAIQAGKTQIILVSNWSFRTHGGQII